MITQFAAYKISSDFFDIIKKEWKLSITPYEYYCVYVFKNIFWAIPISTKVAKLQDIVKKRIAKGKKAQTTIFTDAFTRPTALLINEAIPVHPVFFKEPVMDNKGNILFLIKDEQVLLIKWFKRHQIQHTRQIMKFANDVESLNNLYFFIDNSKEYLLNEIVRTPERVDILDPNNIIHLNIVDELKDNPDCALYASYLPQEKRQDFNFNPSPIINGRKKHIKWSPLLLDDLKKRREIYKQNFETIAKDYNVKHNTISKKINNNTKRIFKKQNRKEKIQRTMNLRKNKKIFVFTDKDILKMKEMYWNNISMSEIGNYFGCSRETIRLKLKELGINDKFRQKLKVEDMKYYISQGYTLIQIAEKLNIKNPQYLYKFLRNNNIALKLKKQNVSIKER